MTTPRSSTLASGAADGPENQTDVGAFLSSINASYSVDYGTEIKPGSPASSKPSLPISATVSLVDAQIDQLELAITKTVNEHKDAFDSQVAASSKVKADLNDLYAMTLEASDQLSDLPMSFSAAAFDYSTALAKSVNQQAEVDAVSALLAATLDLERAEQLLDGGDLGLLSQHLARLRESCTVFDLASDPALDPKRSQRDLSFLSSSTFPIAAVKELRKRCERVQSSLDRVVCQAWSEAVVVSTHRQADFTSARIVVRNSLQLAGVSSERSLPLSELADHLAERGVLPAKAQTLAADLLGAAVAPILASPGSRHRKVLVASKSDAGLGQDTLELSFAANDSSAAVAPVDAIIHLLSFLKRQLFDRIPSEHGRRMQGILVQELVGKTIQQALLVLSEALPDSEQSLHDALKSVQEQADKALELERFLRENGYAAKARGPGEDEDADDNPHALARWSEDAAASFSRRLAGNALDKARQLILAEGQGSTAGILHGSGWESEQIEVESKLAQLESALSSQQQNRQSQAPDNSDMHGSNALALSADDAGQQSTTDWDAFGEESWGGGDVTSKAAIARRQPRPSSSGSMRPGSSSSHYSGASTPRTESPSGMPARRAKAKLGGVRVIKPQDQLGSGPFNSADVPIDDASWGLDEEDEDTLAGASQLSSASVGRPANATPLSRFPPPDQDEAVEDDPWFSSSHDDDASTAALADGSISADERAQSGNSALSAPAPPAAAPMQSTLSSSSTTSAQRQAFAIGADAPSEGDDAWGLSDDDGETAPVPPSAEVREPSFSPQKGERALDGALNAASATHGETADVDDTLDLGDDPWGLSDEQIVESAQAEQSDSQHSVALARANATSPAPSAPVASVAASIDTARQSAGTASSLDDAWQLDDDGDEVRSVDAPPVAPHESAFVSAPDIAAPAQTQQSAVDGTESPPPQDQEGATAMSRSSSSFLPDTTLDDDDDDAWGLKAEESKRLSMLFLAPPSIPAQAQDDAPRDRLTQEHAPCSGLSTVADEEEEDGEHMPAVASAAAVLHDASIAPSQATKEGVEPEPSSQEDGQKEADEQHGLEQPGHQHTDTQSMDVQQDLLISPGPHPDLMEPVSAFSGDAAAFGPPEAAIAAERQKDSELSPPSTANPAANDVLAPAEAHFGVAPIMAPDMDTHAEAAHRETQTETVDNETVAAATDSPATSGPKQAHPSESGIEQDTAAQVQHESDGDDAWAFDDDNNDESQIAIPQPRLTAPRPHPAQAPSSEKPRAATAAKPVVAAQTHSARSPPANGISHKTGSETLPPTAQPTPSLIVPEPLSVPMVRPKERCAISKRSVDLIRLAEQTLADGVRLLQLPRDAMAPSAMAPPPSGPLFAAVCDIFDLHRSLMPVAHGEALRDVPSLSMQFANDCEYMARELDRIVRTSRDTLRSVAAGSEAGGVLDKLDEQAGLTRALGQRWTEAQMATQTRTLLDTLSDAPFSNLFETRRFERCERCIKQVLHTLLQLSKAWKPVLALSSYLSAMGQLSEAVLARILTEVLEVEDIGETESQRLADVVRMLGQLEEVFAEEEGDQKTKVALYVPSWFKASYLIEILTGSLVDIDFLAFEAQALVDYSRKELTGLVKALFTDTPNRAKLLDKIEKAPPGVLLQ